MDRLGHCVVKFRSEWRDFGTLSGAASRARISYQNYKHGITAHVCDGALGFEP